MAHGSTSRIAAAVRSGSTSVDRSHESVWWRVYGGGERYGSRLRPGGGPTPGPARPSTMQSPDRAVPLVDGRRGGSRTSCDLAGVGCSRRVSGDCDVSCRDRRSREGPVGRSHSGLRCNRHCRYVSSDACAAAVLQDMRSSCSGSVAILRGPVRARTSAPDGTPSWSTCRGTDGDGGRLDHPAGEDLHGRYVPQPTELNLRLL